MQLTNEFGEKVFVFLFDRGDLVAAVTPGLALATVEGTVDPGATIAINHPIDDPCKLGIKKFGPGTIIDRLAPFLVAPSGETYGKNADLILTGDGRIIDRSRVVVPNPTPRLPPGKRDEDLPPARAGYSIGVGIANITDPAAADPRSELPMQGWADASQKTTGIETPLFARAFVIADPQTQDRITLVVADIWSCSAPIKQEVVRRLEEGTERRRYNEKNVWIAGTHTHSAPAGYLDYFLYNATAGGFDGHVFECIVTGIVLAIENAIRNLAPGKVYVNTGNVNECGRNRSIEAYNLNPSSERKDLPDTDTQMLLLKFVATSPRGEMPAGALCWYAVHPTNRGQTNTLVNGDNKGWASRLFEDSMREKAPGFVAAFANSNCGDVSGNIWETGDGKRVKEFAPASEPPLPAAGAPQAELLAYEQRMQLYKSKMERNGQIQFKAANDLFQSAKEEVSGPIGWRHKYVDFPKRTGLSGALGVSMAAGSREDGDSHVPLDEGIRVLASTDLGRTSGGVLADLAVFFSAGINRIDRFLIGLSGAQPGDDLLQSLIDAKDASDAERLGHFPKPIMLLTGAVRPDPLTPNILPIQLLRFGNVAVLGIPAEITTMAGRRLRDAVHKALEALNVNHVAIGTYANGYSQYITTSEEYQSQQYEGASTLFGPRTLDVYRRAFDELAAGVVQNKAVVDDAPAPMLMPRVLRKRRMTFRNESPGPVRFRLYLVEDTSFELVLFPGADFQVPAGGDRAIILPLWLFFLTHLQVIAGDEELSWRQAPATPLFPETNELVVFRADRSLIRSRYVPTSRRA